MRQKLAGRAHRPGRLSRGEVGLWALLIVGAAYWANILRGSAGDGPLTLAGSLDAVSRSGAFGVFAWVLLVQRSLAGRDRRPAGPWRISAALVCGLVVLIPTQLTAAASLALLGALAWRDARPISLVMLGLAAESIWRSSLLGPLHVLAGTLDAGIVAALLRAAGHAAASQANVVQTLDPGFAIAIWPPCASSFPLAGVVLAFVVMVLYRGGTPRASHLPWLALSLAASVMLTEMRLSLLALGECQFRWWHDGPGVTVYALLALGLAATFPVLATRGVRRRVMLRAIP